MLCVGFSVCFQSESVSAFAGIRDLIELIKARAMQEPDEKEE
jgi:hypothetical protein